MKELRNEERVTLEELIEKRRLLNDLLLRRKNAIIIKPTSEIYDSRQYVATMMKNIESLGFIFSEELFNILNIRSVEYLTGINNDLVNSLEKMVGANVYYRPMYPNFPTSVMNADETKLFIDQIIHYWSFGTLLPHEEKEDRPELKDKVELKVIKCGNIDMFQEIFTNLLNSKTSLSNTDKEDIELIFKYVPDVVFPNEIPYKENVALIGDLWIESGNNVNSIKKYFKTATDVLRLIVAMSDGDISLAGETRFKKFSRRERRILLYLLENCNNLKEDMKRYKNRWIRIGEILHPSEYKKRFPKAAEAFNALRNNEIIETFNGNVQKRMLQYDIPEAINLLKQRPGEFARKLDYLLRESNSHYKTVIINTFKEVANKVSTPVLLQVMEHFKTRATKDPDIRVFFPKGQLANAHVIENDLLPLEYSVCSKIIEICELALIDIYSTREKLGKVYLSKNFKNYVVPFSQRSASKSFKSAVRGSRFTIPENTKYIRPFIWWTGQYIDIDLSMTLFDDDWNFIEKIGYTHKRSTKINAYHSGDITNGGDDNGKGVAEFIDIDINQAKEAGGRYAVFQIYSYSGIHYCNLKHCMFGWMNREDNESGEIFEPSTVEQRMDITQDTLVAVPVIVDLENNEYIWCDMSLDIRNISSNNGGINLESNTDSVIAVCYAMVNMHKPNLYDLIDLNIQARGMRVYNKEDADIVFDLKDGISPFDLDVIVGQYL